MARYPDPRSGLLPMLHLVQSIDGYVSRDGILFCAEMLGITAAEVSAVATFYTQYKRHPNGTYTVGVCTNTLCAVMGGDAIFDELSDHLGVGHDETTDDGAITLERVECNAACDYAPVVMVNWEFFDNQTPETATALADKLRPRRGRRPDAGRRFGVLVQADEPGPGRVPRRPRRRGCRRRRADPCRAADRPRERLEGAANRGLRPRVSAGSTSGIGHRPVGKPGLVRRAAGPRRRRTREVGKDKKPGEDAK